MSSALQQSSSLDLVNEFDMRAVESFNCATDWSFCLKIGERDSAELSLDSDMDEQIVLTVPFNQLCRLEKIKIYGRQGEEAKSAPKTVKLFANKPNYQFEDCERKKASQKIELTQESVVFGEGKASELDLTAFANVRTLTVFVESNQGGSEKSRLGKIEIYGTPVHTTQMSELKSC